MKPEVGEEYPQIAQIAQIQALMFQPGSLTPDAEPPLWGAVAAATWLRRLAATSFRKRSNSSREQVHDGEVAIVRTRVAGAPRIKANEIAASPC